MPWPSLALDPLARRPGLHPGYAGFVQPIEWRIDQFQLVRSTGHGPTYHYEELGRWPLDGEPEAEGSQIALL